MELSNRIVPIFGILLFNTSELYTPLLNTLMVAPLASNIWNICLDSYIGINE